MPTFDCCGSICLVRNADGELVPFNRLQAAKIAAENMEYIDEELVKFEFEINTEPMTFKGKISHREWKRLMKIINREFNWRRRRLRRIRRLKEKIRRNMLKHEG